MFFNKSDILQNIDELSERFALKRFQEIYNKKAFTTNLSGEKQRHMGNPFGEVGIDLSSFEKSLSKLVGDEPELTSAQTQRINEFKALLSTVEKASKQTSSVEQTPSASSYFSIGGLLSSFNIFSSAKDSEVEKDDKEVSVKQSAASSPSHS